MRHGSGGVVGVLRSSLGYARDFACGLGRPQRGSTSALRRMRDGYAQDDKGKNSIFMQGLKPVSV